MKSTYLFALLSLVAFSSAVQAQPQNVSCYDFEAAIDREIKGAALLLAEGLSEKSAPRQTNRSIEINNKLQLVNINLQLQIQNKCPVRKIPVSPSSYISEALDCILAQLKGENNSSACDIANWKGLAK